MNRINIKHFILFYCRGAELATHWPGMFCDVLPELEAFLQRIKNIVVTWCTKPALENILMMSPICDCVCFETNSRSGSCRAGSSCCTSQALLPPCEKDRSVISAGVQTFWAETGERWTHIHTPPAGDTYMYATHKNLDGCSVSIWVRWEQKKCPADEYCWADEGKGCSQAARR